MDLLYGMMLESGNDAAQVIGENMGKLWEDYKNTDGYRPKNIVIELNGKGDYKNGEQLFLKFMNLYGKTLGLKATTFLNCHGNSETGKNYSTSEDIVTMSKAALRITLFRNIIKTRNYASTVKKADKADSYKILKWENTNRLISNHPHCEGIKNGYTKTAGSC